jgi:molybdopterin-guanine dinucleotide biosynthesis protein A
MGRDKALVQFAGSPLVSHALGIFREAGLEASIAGTRSPLAAFAPVVEDSIADRGPLGGICAALASTLAARAVFLPVDLPLMPASLVVLLLEHARVSGRAVTLAAVNGFVQTFPVVLAATILPVIEAELEAGRRGCFSAFQSAAASLGQAVSVLPVELLTQAAQLRHPDGLPACRWFVNINVPGDLERAEELPGIYSRLQGARRVS